LGEIRSTMRRVNILSTHVTAASEFCAIPEIAVDNRAMMKDSAGYLAPLMKEYPDMFFLKQKNGTRELIISDRLIYEQILSDEAVYGSPGEAENMLISQTIFSMPQDTMVKHLHNFSNGVKRKFQDVGGPAAAEIGLKMEAELDKWPDEGECSLDELGDVVFWAMIEVLFGPVASKRVTPNLPGEFGKIDAHIFKMLRSGKVDEQVRLDIDAVVDIFVKGIDAGMANGPVVELYREILKDEKNGKQDAARMAVTAWWGGLGNTLPSTMHTLAYILGTPGVTETAIAAVRGQGEFASDEGKRYLTGCLKEFLRLCVAGGANRTVKKTHEITCTSGRRYQIEKGTTAIIHFITHHFDPAFHPEPHAFNPMRYLGATPSEDQTGTLMNGVQYAWAPFSGGRHRCSGYALVVEEVPAALQVFMRKLDLQLTETLPAFDWSARGFGVKFPVKEVRIRYKKRA